MPARACSSWTQNRRVLDNFDGAVLGKRPPRAPAAPKSHTDPLFPSKLPRLGDRGRNWDMARGVNDGLLFSTVLQRGQMKRTVAIATASYARSSCYFVGFRNLFCRLKSSFRSTQIIDFDSRAQPVILVALVVQNYVFITVSRCAVIMVQYVTVT